MKKKRPFSGLFFLSSPLKQKPKIIKTRAHPTTSPSSSFFFSSFFLLIKIEGNRARFQGKLSRSLSLQRQARVLALAAALGAVANVLLRGPVEGPDQRGDDDEGPALGARDAEDLAGALAAEAVVDLLWSEEWGRLKTERKF